MTNKIIKKLKGFSLIETLVAVLLLATAIAGPLTIASKSLLAALVAKDQVTAFFLAQDAIEYVRFARDTNKLHESSGWNWLTADGGAATPTNLNACTGTNGCYLDSASQSPAVPTSCGTTNPCIHSTFSSSRFICYNPTANRFSYVASLTCSGGTVERTPFARQVSITGSGDERLVTVTVSWTDTANKIRSVTARESIFDWQ